MVETGVEVGIRDWRLAPFGFFGPNLCSNSHVPIVTFQSVSLNWHGGEASGMAEMGMVAGGQHSGDRRGDRCGDQCGDWHRNWRLVDLVVLTWWSVFGFGGRRLVGWVAMGLLGF